MKKGSSAGISSLPRFRPTPADYCSPQLVSGASLNRRRQLPTVWLGLFAGVLLVHLTWEWLNFTPPAWDQAAYQMQGWRICQTFKDRGLLAALGSLRPDYPPLYPLMEAPLLCAAPENQFLAFLTNLPGLFLLSFFAYRLASTLMGSREAEWAGAIVCLFPMVAWTARESLLDVAVSGWVCLWVYLVWRSCWLTKRREVVLLGLVLAAGMLTRLTFVFLAAPPLIYALHASRDRRRSLLNLGLAAIVAVPFVSAWLLPNLPSLWLRFQRVLSDATYERDPGFTEFLGVIYYPRALVSYYLYLPLTILFVLGLIGFLRRDEEQPPEAALVFWWLFGGMATMTLLPMKDPRYILPLAAPAAILLVHFWKTRPAVLRTIYALTLLTFFTVTFEVPGAPRKLALFDDGEDYLPLRREWVLFQTRYFDVAGPPTRENWRYTELLEAIPPGSQVGFAPEHPRFHSIAFALAAARTQKQPPTVLRLGYSLESLGRLAVLDAVVGKTGSQGLQFFTGWNSELYQRLQRHGWLLAARFTLPDGSEALLWLRPPQKSSRWEGNSPTPGG